MKNLCGRLLLAAVAALIWTEIVLISQNTLLLNGNWISTKRKSAMGLTGADSFLVARPALSRNRLNMGSWYGFNEVLFKDALRPKAFRFRLRLADGAHLSVVFDKSPGGFSGLRLSRDPNSPGIFFKSAPEGRFISKSELSPFRLDGRRHLIDLRFQNGRVTASLDGREIGSHIAETDVFQHVGFRAGGGQALVDDVVIEDASGRIYRDSFRNTKHNRRILLLHVALFALLLGGALFVPSLEPAAALLSLTLIGALWLCFDYFYWSGVQVDARSKPLNSSGGSKILRRVEGLRYGAFEKWNGLLTGVAPVTRRDLLRQGYPDRQLWAGPIFCSSSSECGQDIRPLFPVRKRAYRILLLGTSQALGAGAARLNDTFFVRVHRRLTRHFRDRFLIESLNISVSGSNAQDLLAAYKDRYLAFSPDLVLISLGNNDLPGRLKSGLAGFLARNQSKGIKTMLLEEANIHGGSAVFVSKLEVIRELGKSFRVSVHDLNGFLRGEQASDPGFLWWDHVHLTSYGQRLTAEWLAPRVIEFVETDIRSP